MFQWNLATLSGAIQVKPEDHGVTRVLHRSPGGTPSAPTASGHCSGCTGAAYVVPYYCGTTHAVWLYPSGGAGLGPYDALRWQLTAPFASPAQKSAATQPA